MKHSVRRIPDRVGTRLTDLIPIDIAVDNKPQPKAGAGDPAGMDDRAANEESSVREDEKVGLRLPVLSIQPSAHETILGLRGVAPTSYHDEYNDGEGWSSGDHRRVRVVVAVRLPATARIT